MAVGIIAFCLLIVGPTIGVLAEQSCDGGLSEQPILVAAFNIKHFGQAKSEDGDAMDSIVRILTQYDIILVQETRDATGDALRTLWSKLNRTDSWGLVASEAVGRTNYKEQYVFYFRESHASLMDSFLLKDSGDVYEREPFAVEFRYYSVSAKKKRRLVLLALHAKPDAAYEELERLSKDIVFCDNHFTDAGGVVALGDFNADCSYVSETQLSELKIFNDKSFTSLIPHEADTTAGKSDCAYDRIVVYGDEISARDGQVFDYETEYDLSNKKAIDVSDHYPVYFKLY